MKKHITLSVVFILIVVIMTGCHNASFQKTTKEDDSQNHADSIIYDDLSKRFTITVYPTKIVTEDGHKNIVYSLSVTNKSEEAYKNFIVTIAMSKSLDPYLAAGAVSIPLTKFDMAAKSDLNSAEAEGKGADIEFQQVLSDEDFMHEAGLKYEDVWKLGQSFELWLQWDGGIEKYELTSDVIDETKN